ncbi:UNVERIFIED_CONTAM: hypothetical protein Sangu_2539300 [Sesamum angustifolium]|uniref:Reverse transcriptase n=1 Tax=Sesamum angustifolium TaxID=2727405 RepID=A0AAW2J9L5_9LAMI
MPNELGGESACKVDVEYEWIPHKCTGCLSLGHSTKECPISKPTKPAVSIYVRKSTPIIPVAPELKLMEKVHAAPFRKKSTISLRLTELARRGQSMEGIRVSARRELWQGLIDLAITVGNEPWLVGGDFNAVLDLSEVSGASGDIRVAMNEFNDCILQTGLLPLPMQGERFTWHNCSLDAGAFGRDWIDCLLMIFGWKMAEPVLYMPHTSYIGSFTVGFERDCRNMQVSLFRFDNYLALSPGFLASVHSIWRHPIVGTPMYSVTRKLKALKPVFRQQRRCKGDLAMNVKLAAGFLEVAQNILQYDRHNSLLLLLEHCCRLVYLKASKLEQIMLRQRAKLQWLKGGDQCSRIFFRRVATRRANKRVFQISDDDGNEQTDSTVINSIFVEFFQGLLGETGLIGPLTFGIYAHGLGIFSRRMRLGLLFDLLP